jgi:hypothetical protein
VPGGEPGGGELPLDALPAELGGDLRAQLLTGCEADRQVERG